MRAECLAAAAVALSALSATAQESCDVSSRVDLKASSAVFRETMVCGDGTSVIILTCRRGGKTIGADLPVAPFEAKVGDKHLVVFTLGKRKLERMLTVSAADRTGDGSEFGRSHIDLKRDDPLLKALLKPEENIPAAFEGATTNVGLRKSRHHTRFKSHCGL